MKWLRKWSFFMFLFISGGIFFTVTSSWNLLWKPFTEMGNWYQQRVDAMNGGILASTTGANNNIISSGDRDRDEVSQQVSHGNMAAEMDDDSQTMEQPQENTKEQNSVEHSAEVSKDVEKRNPEDVIYQTVEDDYFADAVFIGDSRTVGMFEYGGLENISTFYASTGLTVYKLFDSPIVTVPGEKEKLTIEEALSQRQFAKIYLMIGINEMGTGNVSSFMQKYKEVLNHLQELQPDAIIYLQAIMKVTTERSEKGDYITNAGIEERNLEIEKLADNSSVFYLDVNPLICDETGGMETTYTFDGVHLKAQFIPIWKDFLKQHAVLLD